jgi:tripartite-type tricarboxylate transporter receptor subunit TctC
MTEHDAGLTVRTMAPPGASQDLFLRVLQPVLEQRFGRRMLVDNLPGDDGVRAALAAEPQGFAALRTSVPAADLRT